MVSEETTRDAFRAKVAAGCRKIITNYERGEIDGLDAGSTIERALDHAHTTEYTLWPKEATP